MNTTNKGGYMKKLMTSIMFGIVLLFSANATADIECSISLAYPCYASDMGQPITPILKATAGKKFYAWGSYERPEMQAIDSHTNSCLMVGVGVVR